MTLCSAKKKTIFWGWLGFPVFLMGCAHAYHYEPEIAEDTSRVWRGGIVFPVPPTSHPEFRIRLVSLGVVPAPSIDGENKVPMLLVRMFILRPEALPQPAFPTMTPDPEYLDPAEQSVRFPNGSTSKPGLVHANNQARPLIQIGPGEKQVIELFFNLPANGVGTGPLASFTFKWKVHFREGKSEEHTTRFSRSDHVPQESLDQYSDDPFYSFSLSPVIPPDWTGTDWFWWYPFHRDDRTFWP
jgi:hypothetical protein